jgi:hypothetical protein
LSSPCSSRGACSLATRSFGRNPAYEQAVDPDGQLRETHQETEKPVSLNIFHMEKG